jgi:hypothetical protein
MKKIFNAYLLGIFMLIVNLFSCGTPSDSENSIEFSRNENNKWYKELMGKKFNRYSDEFKEIKKALEGQEISVSDLLISEATFDAGYYLPYDPSKLNSYIGKIYKIDELDPRNRINISFHFKASGKTKNADKLLDNTDNIWDAKLKKPLSHNKEFMESECSNDFLSRVGDLSLDGCDYSYWKKVGAYYFELKQCASERVLEQFLNGNFYRYRVNNEVNKCFSNNVSFSLEENIENEYLQKIRLKGVVTEVKVSEKGYIKIYLEKVEILELTPTALLTKLLELSPKPLKFDKERAIEEGEQIIREEEEYYKDEDESPAE